MYSTELRCPACKYPIILESDTDLLMGHCPICDFFIKDKMVQKIRRYYSLTLSEKIDILIHNIFYFAKFRGIIPFQFIFIFILLLLGRTSEICWAFGLMFYFYAHTLLLGKACKNYDKYLKEKFNNYKSGKSKPIN
ncbi:MAG: hypothetical protein K9M56_04405 [Victivallales bacterium]|nr:hypothetical protein [Victivallales bacterium]